MEVYEREKKKGSERARSRRVDGTQVHARKDIEIFTAWVFRQWQQGQGSWAATGQLPPVQPRSPMCHPPCISFRTSIRDRIPSEAYRYFNSKASRVRDCDNAIQRSISHLIGKRTMTVNLRLADIEEPLVGTEGTVKPHGVVEGSHHGDLGAGTGSAREPGAAVGKGHSVQQVVV